MLPQQSLRAPITFLTASVGRILAGVTLPPKPPWQWQAAHGNGKLGLYRAGRARYRAGRADSARLLGTVLGVLVGVVPSWRACSVCWLGMLGTRAGHARYQGWACWGAHGCAQPAAWRANTVLDTVLGVLPCWPDVLSTPSGRAQHGSTPKRACWTCWVPCWTCYRAGGRATVLGS